MTNEEDSVYITKQNPKETWAMMMVIVLLYEYAKRKNIQIDDNNQKNIPNKWWKLIEFIATQKNAKSKHGNI
jgi:hypothetical protein